MTIKMSLDIAQCPFKGKSVSVPIKTTAIVIKLSGKLTELYRGEGGAKYQQFHITGKKRYSKVEETILQLIFLNFCNLIS